MKLVAYDIRKLSGCKGFYKKSANLELLEEFANSAMNCAKVEDFTQRNARGCAASLNSSIKRYKMLNIEAHEVKGEVFLIKKSKYEQNNT